MNKQREVIYSQRREALETEEIHTLIQEMEAEALEELVQIYLPVEAYVDDWDMTGLNEAIRQHYDVHLTLTSTEVSDLSREALLEHIRTQLDEHYTAKMQLISPDQCQALERFLVLQMIDKHWKDHLLAMDHLKEGIGLRGYAQKNPLNEYKREAFSMFVDMTERVKADVIEHLFKVKFTTAEGSPVISQPRARESRKIEHYGTSFPAVETARDNGTTTVQTIRRQGEKIGRNAPCPCGSGKKYKKCCGAAV
jgi:preprotein translocase subunit SecA